MTFPAHDGPSSLEGAGLAPRGAIEPGDPAAEARLLGTPKLRDPLGRLAASHRDEVLDRDHFKVVDDRWGRVAGDAGLRAVAVQIGAEGGEASRPGRPGGRSSGAAARGTGAEIGFRGPKPQGRGGEVPIA